MAQAMHLNVDFQRSNGLLKLFTVLIGATTIGLTVSKFRVSEFNEVIFLATIVFCCSVSFIHFFLTFIVKCTLEGPCSKIADFIFHMTGGILLLVSSVLMLLIATSKGIVLDYRFHDTNHVLVRTIAGIFGLQNAFLYFTLGYLTITNKYFVYCQTNFKPQRTKDVEEIGGKGQAEIATVASDSDPEIVTVQTEAVNARIPSKFFLDRFTWRRLLVDEILEARLATMLMGALNIGLIADSYQVGYETEEYFFSMVVVCFCLTFISQVSYASGVVRISESASTLIDTIIQLFSCANLLAGGVLMLGAVIQSNTYGYQYKSVERTSAAVLGIINGCLYCYIGVNAKRDYFSRLGQSGTNAFPSGSGSRRESIRNRIDRIHPIDPKTKLPTGISAIEAVVQQDPKKPPC